MKRQVQETGIRKWYGDDWTQLQDELYKVLDGHFEQYGNMIIKGCEVAGSEIMPGIVALSGKDESNADIYKIAKFEGLQSVASWPVYLVLEKTEEKRLYNTGTNKNVAITYVATPQYSLPTGEYLTINQDGYNRTFRDALQSANYRFVTDAEKSNWNSKAAGVHGHAATDISQSSSYRFVTDTEKSTWNNARAGAVSDIRDGVATDKNTLKKFWDAISLGLWSGTATVLSTSKHVDIGGTLKAKDTIDVKRASDDGRFGYVNFVDSAGNRGGYIGHGKTDGSGISLIGDKATSFYISVKTGIKTNAPEHELEVNGIAKATSFFTSLSELSGNDLVFKRTTGDSYIKQTGGKKLVITGDAKLSAYLNPEGSVGLYYNNVKKFETSSSGINVTGSVNGSSNGSFSETVYAKRFRVNGNDDGSMWHLGVTGDSMFRGAIRTIGGGATIDGNVNIGTTSNTELLHLYKYQSDYGIHLQGSLSNWKIKNKYSNNGALEISEGDTYAFVFGKDGHASFPKTLTVDDVIIR